MKAIETSGRRKQAIARAVLNDGKGVVRINAKLLDVYEPELARLRILEPLMLSGPDVASKYNINVNV